MTTGIRKEFDFFFAEGLSKRFGGVAAVSDFSLELKARTLVGLIGPNGAGKTTVFNLITGMERLDSGTVYFRQRYITDEPAHRISMLGIARTFQNTRLLGHLSVLDNVKVACHAHIRYNVFEAALRLPRFHRVERDIEAKSREFLDLVGLAGEQQTLAASLPYGLRRKLEIARALATGADLLLLDEPGAGLNPTETAELTRLIRLLRDDFGVSVLLIEHDMPMVMSLCEHIVVLNFGRTIAQGSPDAVKSNPAVIEAYLGKPRSKPGEPPC